MGKLISIVTVCFNAVEEIQRTLSSILNQSTGDFEYLVVDGKSSDGTIEILKEKATSFEQKGIDFRLISEKDKGIYNAMNKSIDLANGDWILFLNAGDVLYDEYSIGRVYDQLQSMQQADIAYGDIVLKKGDKYKLEKAGNLDTILYTIPFCHQATFVRREVLQQYRFDECFKICADHDLFVRCYKDGKVFKYLSFPVAVYEMFGASSQDSSYRFWMERLLIQKNDGYISEDDFEKKIEALKKNTRYLRFRQAIKKFVPSVIIKTRQEKIDQALGWSMEYPKYENKDYNQK